MNLKPVEAFYIVAALILLLAQFLSAAHAHDSVDAHYSSAHCMICNIACPDDDFNGRHSADELFSALFPAYSDVIPTSRLESASVGPKSVIRGPP